MRPYIVQAITDRHGKSVKTFKPQRVRRAISSQTALRVRNIMKTVITKGGTGVKAALEGYAASGKTGTARKLDKSGKYSDKKHVASFVGFTPSDNPGIAIVVVIDEPREKFYGGTVAAPVFKKIAQETLNYLGIPPQETLDQLRVSVNGEVSG
jgi:cell division protein FtsI (penicillin-binding protein 3)